MSHLKISQDCKIGWDGAKSVWWGTVGYLKYLFVCIIHGDKINIFREGEETKHWLSLTNGTAVSFSRMANTNVSFPGRVM